MVKFTMNQSLNAPKLGFCEVFFLGEATEIGKNLRPKKKGMINSDSILPKTKAGLENSHHFSEDTSSQMDVFVFHCYGSFFGVYVCFL